MKAMSSRKLSPATPALKTETTEAGAWVCQLHAYSYLVNSVNPGKHSESPRVGKGEEKPGRKTVQTTVGGDTKEAMRRSSPCKGKIVL